MRKTLLNAVLAVALGLPVAAYSADSAAIAELKQMILEMKQQHEQQIKALEERVVQAEERAAAAEEIAENSENTVAAVEEQIQAQSQTSDNNFNPAISVVLQGGIASYSKDPEEFHFEGMPLGGEAGLHDEGPAVWESEIIASASIDNLFYGQLTIGLHTDDGEIEVDVEEAFVDTLSLPGGFGLRFGRFYSALGYLNEHHTHAWDFADAPLAYQAFLGKQYRDDGIRATWVAPTEDLLVEVGAEALRGDSYPGGGNDNNFGAVRNLFMHIGGDVGEDSSWQLGISRLDVDVVERSSGGHAHGHGSDGPVFSGDSDLTVFDAVWKTALGGERALIFQGEYFMRDEDGRVTVSEDAGDALINYDGEQEGWYLQGIFQFDRRWRAGLRYDRLEANNDLVMLSNATGEADEDIFEESGFLSGNNDPHRWSAMVDWTPSEFSRLRLQYAKDESRGETDHQVFLQYIMTLGAHGAHQY
ncbi:hypothetical protein DJ030_01330 [bacterium endosymbiont of Escarpia laminata]|nr:MAG: hypothetical protein DJ030_01330 [bacterium endosymbiont of Escarpia laminata]